MDFALTPEQEAIRDAIAAFVMHRALADGNDALRSLREVPHRVWAEDERDLRSES